MSEQSDDATTQPTSRLTEEDWLDIMESEFVDFTESEMGTKIGFVFKHPDIGLHGFQFHKEDGTMKPCSFKEVTA